MKRLFVAAALLAITVGLCVGTSLALNHSVDRLLAACDSVDAAYSVGGADAAREPAAQLAACFTAQTRWFPLFLPHDRLDAAADSVYALSPLLSGDAAAFETELSRCRRRLEDLRDSERLTFQNLL